MLVNWWENVNVFSGILIGFFLYPFHSKKKPLSPSSLPQCMENEREVEEIGLLCEKLRKNK